MVDNLAVPQGQSAGSTSRGLNITLWVLQVILALGFALSGLTKLSGAPDALVVFKEMGTDGWMPYVIGSLEIIGAIGLLIRRVTGMAAVAFVALMLGAVLSHLILGVGSPIPAIVLLVLSALVTYGRWDSFSDLLTGRNHG